MPKDTIIRKGLKVHFGSYWIYAVSGTNIKITAWFENGWTNCTVYASGTQQIYNGTKPSSVYINGLYKTEGDGWSYSSGIVTITGATSSESLYWYSDQYPTYSNIGYNTTMAGYPCKFSVYCSDDHGLATYHFATNNSGTWLYDSYTAFQTNPSWANVTKTLNSTVGMIVGFKWDITDSIGQITTTTTGTLTLTTTDTTYPYFIVSPTWNSTKHSTNCTFTTECQDDVGLNNYMLQYDYGNGVLVNGSWYSFSGNPAWASVTKMLNSTPALTVRFRFYANDTSNHISATSIYSFVITQNWWQMSFSWYDLDGNLIDNQISWKLYNGSQLLTYTQGAFTLTDGTYTLKTYYLASLIYQMTLPTSTYGNTTVSVYPTMKALVGGYIAFNNTVSSLTINSDTSTNKTFTANGTGIYQIIIVASQNATSIKKDGVIQEYNSVWTYNATGGYIKIVSELSTWELDFTTPSIEEPWFAVTVFLVTVGAGATYWFYRRLVKTKKKKVE